MVTGEAILSEWHVISPSSFYLRSFHGQMPLPIRTTTVFQLISSFPSSSTYPLIHDRTVTRCAPSSRCRRTCADHRRSQRRGRRRCLRSIHFRKRIHRFHRCVLAFHSRPTHRHRCGHIHSGHPRHPDKGLGRRILLFEDQLLLLLMMMRDGVGVVVKMVCGSLAQEWLHCVAVLAGQRRSDRRWRWFVSSSGGDNNRWWWWWWRRWK